MKPTILGATNLVDAWLKQNWRRLKALGPEIYQWRMAAIRMLHDHDVPELNADALYVADHTWEQNPEQAQAHIRSNVAYANAILNQQLEVFAQETENKLKPSPEDEGLSPTSRTGQ